MKLKYKVGIFLFNNVEVLDFAGPFEVFSTASRMCVRQGKEPPFELFTFSNHEDVITARGGLKVLSDYTLANVPQADVLIIPGGVMDEPLSQDEVTDFIQSQKDHVEIIASVCTGAFLLAKAHLLNGLSATTHWKDLTGLKEHPGINVVSDVKFVDEGNIVTSAGIASGITMSLHLVSRLTNPDLAQQTAVQMEYHYEE